MLARLSWLTLVLSTACSQRPCPVKPEPAPPIIVTPDRTPCELPELPSPIEVHAQVDGDRVIYLRAEVADLAAYLVALRSYAVAARDCLADPGAP